MHKKTKTRHIGKLDTLIKKQKYTGLSTNSELDLSGTQLKRWVINRSDRTLTDTETRVLARGLNFAISPEKVPVEDFIVAAETACQKLPSDERPALRAEIAGVLRSAKPPKPNISKEERQALGVLAKEKDILILPADKGRCTVILNKSEYTKQVETMLSDRGTYTPLTEDPTGNIKRKLAAILGNLKESGKITKEKWREIYPTAENTPRMYCTPKIHKKTIPAPLRPIVDCTGSVTYATSKYLVSLIRPLLGKTQQHCKNSAQLAKDLVNVTVEKDEQLISHDVVALFTKTPVDPTLQICKQRLQKDKTLKKRTLLSTDDIMQLLTLCTKNSYFSFNEKLYKQTEGFAMGDPLSALMSNLFMEDLEQKAISTAPAECGLTLWKRYVDDILNKVKTNTTEILTDHLNVQDPSGNIKFTNEEMQERKLPFLDVKLIANPDGSIRLQVYRKETHTDQYLMFDSHHPVEHKLSVIRTLLDRKDRIVTEEEDKVEEEKHVKAVLKQCKYPDWAIQKVERQLKDKKEGVVKEKKTKSKENKFHGSVTIPYVCGITERIRRVMKKHGITTPARPHRTLRQTLVHPKDKVKDEDKCGVVYHIPCLSCSQVYIGETGRKLSVRIGEHKKETEKVTAPRKTRSTSVSEDTSKFKSAVSIHCREKNHVMNFEDVSVIDRESIWIRRRMKEAMHVRKLNPEVPMNQDDGGYELPHIWDPLLRKAPSTSGQPGAPLRRPRHQRS